MSHSEVVISISCTSREVSSGISPPPSVPRVSLCGTGSIVEITGMVLLGVTTDLPVAWSNCLEDEVILMDDVVDAIMVFTDVLTSCLSPGCVVSIPFMVSWGSSVAVSLA